MANPWDNDPIVDEEEEVMAAPVAPETVVSAENPWDADPEIDLPEDPEVGMDFKGYTNALDNPEQLQRNIDANNDIRTAGSIVNNEEDILQSNDELYSGVRNDPKYGELNEYENSLLYSAGQVPTPWGENSLKGETPPHLVEMKKQRDAVLKIRA